MASGQMTRYSRAAYDMKAQMQRHGLRLPQLDYLLQTSWSGDVWEEYSDGLLFDCYCWRGFTPINEPTAHIERMHYTLASKHTHRQCNYFFWRTEVFERKGIFPWLRW